MKKLLIGLLVFSGFAGQLPQAYAEGVSLAVTPPNIVIQTTAPAVIEKPIKIINKNDQSITLDIIYEPFTQSQSKNGKVSYILGSDPDIFNKIAILDNAQMVKTITLSPRQEKTLMLRVNLAENEPNYDYYFSILFVSKATSFGIEYQKEDIKVYTNLQGAIGINVILSIFTGNKKPEGFIDAYNIPFLLQNGPVPFEITFRNTGSYLLTPQGVILIKNMFGQTIGKVTIQKTFVLANTTRTISAHWDEPFLFGPYTAELLLTTPDSGVTFRRTIMFIGVPMAPIVSIIGTIIAFLLLSSRLRRYL